MASHRCDSRDNIFVVSPGDPLRRMAESFVLAVLLRTREPQLQMPRRSRPVLGFGSSVPPRPETGHIIIKSRMAKCRTVILCPSTRKLAGAMDHKGGFKGDRGGQTAARGNAAVSSNLAPQYAVAHARGIPMQDKSFLHARWRLS